MHIALIVDEERLESEESLYRGICAGLIANGVQLTVVVPKPAGEVLAQEPDEIERIEIRMKVPLWMRRTRAHQVAGMLESGVPDLLHAMGEDAWKVGLDLARVLDRPVTLDLWAAEQVARVPHSRSSKHVAAYVAPTEPIAELLRQRVDAELVSHVPIGVVATSSVPSVLQRHDESIGLAIVGTGRDIVAYRAMLTGLSRVTRELPQIQACLELRGPYEHEIWRLARRLDLLGHISTIVNAARHRPLLRGCDLLIWPERLGVVRSLLLEVMASGLPVLAAKDPNLDMLIHQQTAHLVDEPDPDEWARRLRQLLGEPEAARRLGASARAWVATNNRLVDHVSGLQRAFGQVISGGAHAFA